MQAIFEEFIALTHFTPKFRQKLKPTWVSRDKFRNRAKYIPTRLFCGSFLIANQ
jgi:hypothetical protein